MATLVPVAQSYLNFRGDVRDSVTVVVGMSAVKP